MANLRRLCGFSVRQRCRKSHALSKSPSPFRGKPTLVSPDGGIKAVKLSRIVKSPLTYIAVVAAITAFAAGLFISARAPDLAGSGVREVVVLRTVTYRNPDGTWPSPVPTATPPTGQDGYDPTLHPDATGLATMGKLLYLYDGGSIQLPPDVYVRTHMLIGTCLDRTNCPNFQPLYWLGETTGF